MTVATGSNALKSLSIPAAILCTLLLGFGLLVQSPAAQGMTRQDLHTVQNFQLTEDYLARYQAVQKDISKNPAQLAIACVTHGKPIHGHNTSLAEAAAKWTTHSGVSDMLASHDMTAKEFMVGQVALAMAMMGYMKQQHPKLAKRLSGRDGEAPLASDANIAFYAAHRQQIHQFMSRMGQQMLAGHRMPRKCQ